MYKFKVKDDSTVFHVTKIHGINTYSVDFELFTMFRIILMKVQTQVKVSPIHSTGSLPARVFISSKESGTL